MLTRRHRDARGVPASDRYAEGSDGDTATTSTTVQTGDENGGDNPPEGAVSEDAYTLDELKDQARELDLPVSGTKAELVERINAKLAEDSDTDPPTEGDE